MPFFKVNWRLEGLTESALQAGETVEAEFEKVEKLVAHGVLTLLSEKPTEPAPEPDLSTLTAADLVAYAKRRFNFELEPTLEREAMLAELAFLKAGNPELGETPTIVDVNGPPKTLPEMTKAEIVAFAKTAHGVDLDLRLSKPALIAEVEALEAKK